MGPLTAQKVADLFGACMPTQKLVDSIYENAEIKLTPITYIPIDNQNETVQKFIEHNLDIESLRIAASGMLGQLIAGIKKDVVLSNRINDPVRPNHVVIYGWHQLDGSAIQPLTNIHINSYVDYSHGIRLMDSEIQVDGEVMAVQTVLSDPVLYKLLSNESEAMMQPTYIPENDIPVIR
jgi:hypothetical protein